MNEQFKDIPFSQYLRKKTSIMNDLSQSQKLAINILVISEVHKNRIDNQQSVKVTNYAISQLNKHYPYFKFFSFYQQQFPQTMQFCKNNRFIHYVLAVGCNDTLMYTFYKFQNSDTPPVLGISVEGESTLFNFTYCNIDLILQNFVHKIKQNTIEKCLQSFSKLQIVHGETTKNATCQIQIGRGPNIGLVKMELYLKSTQEQQRIFIGKLWGDGLVISTSLGSVTRSMVLNGPIIHKKLQCIILIPVCPLSLKFRPIVLPMTSQLIVKIQKGSRSGGSVYMDGMKTGIIIEPDEQIIIKKSNVKTVMVSDLNGSYQTNLFKNLQDFLSWGQQFSSLDYKKYISQHQ